MTRYVRTSMFPTTAQLIAAEAEKTKLENDGWALVETTPAYMKYAKAVS